jgi:purine-binding chemotaxis protein CheW
MPETIEERPSQRLCLFQRSDRTFGLGVDEVVEVLPAVALTAVPVAPPLLAGLFNLRGELIPVLRLERLFELGERPPARREQYLVAHHADGSLALWVDRVVDIAAVLIEELQQLTPRAFLRGEVEVGGLPVLLLDLAQIVRAAEDEVSRALEQRLAAIR